MGSIEVYPSIMYHLWIIIRYQVLSRSRYVIYSKESYKLKLINKTAEPKQIHRKQRFVVIIIPMFANTMSIYDMLCYFAQKIESVKWSVNIIFSLKTCFFHTFPAIQNSNQPKNLNFSVPFLLATILQKINIIHIS